MAHDFYFFQNMLPMFICKGGDYLRGGDGCVVGWMVTTMDFDVGVLLLSATLSMGMSTLASGKYVATHLRGMG